MKKYKLAFGFLACTFLMSGCAVDRDRTNYRYTYANDRVNYGYAYTNDRVVNYRARYADVYAPAYGTYPSYNLGYGPDYSGYSSIGWGGGYGGYYGY